MSGLKHQIRLLIQTTYPHSVGVLALRSNMLAVLDFLKTVYAIRWGMWFYKSTHYYSDMSTNPPGLYFPSLLVQSNEWALKVNAYYVDYDRCIFFQTPVMTWTDMQLRRASINWQWHLLQSQILHNVAFASM